MNKTQPAALPTSRVVFYLTRFPAGFMIITVMLLLPQLFFVQFLITALRFYRIL